MNHKPKNKFNKYKYKQQKHCFYMAMPFEEQLVMQTVEGNRTILKYVSFPNADL